MIRQTNILFVLLFFLPFSEGWKKNVVATAGVDPPTRPALVQAALANNQDLYYFGVGSNLLRSKIENRSLCGNKIDIKSMQAAKVKNHRLAFNLRGFPPLEPGMGSLEPTNSTNKALLAYEKEECHGSLVQLSAQDYDKLMKSEGVGNGRPDQGYEEVVVEAWPYTSKKNARPIQAIALRARPHVRLSQDYPPSQRYMNLLVQGAAELGLEEDYQHFLQSHPVATSSRFTRKIAVCNLFWTILVSFRLKLRFLSKVQSWFVWRVYSPNNISNNIAKRILSDALTALVLLPGAIPGGILLLCFVISKKELPSMMKTLVDNHWGDTKSSPEEVIPSTR